ncbi:MAG: hypothetical protein M3526_03775 [Actinomycetota bacterium]|nr:hypothetical protein [Actinomycetota bacterium]
MSNNGDNPYAVVDDAGQLDWIFTGSGWQRVRRLADGGHWNGVGLPPPPNISIPGTYVTCAMCNVLNAEERCSTCPLRQQEVRKRLAAIAAAQEQDRQRARPPWWRRVFKRRSKT